MALCESLCQGAGEENIKARRSNVYFFLTTEQFTNFVSSHSNQRILEVHNVVDLGKLYDCASQGVL